MIEDAKIEDAKDIFDEVHHLAGKYSIIELLSEEMKNDKELLLMAVESNGWVIDRLPKIYRDDDEIKNKSEQTKKMHVNYLKSRCEI